MMPETLEKLIVDKLWKGTQVLGKLFLALSPAFERAVGSVDSSLRSRRDFVEYLVMINKDVLWER